MASPLRFLGAVPVAALLVLLWLRAGQGEGRGPVVPGESLVEAVYGDPTAPAGSPGAVPEAVYGPGGAGLTASDLEGGVIVLDGFDTPVKLRAVEPWVVVVAPGAPPPVIEVRLGELVSESRDPGPARVFRPVTAGRRAKAGRRPAPSGWLRLGGSWSGGDQGVYSFDPELEITVPSSAAASHLGNPYRGGLEIRIVGEDEDHEAEEGKQ